MITVYVGGDVFEIPGGTRFATDEHNNLCVYTGRQGDRLTHLFNGWQHVEATDDAS